MPRDYTSLYNEELARARVREQVAADLLAEKLGDELQRRAETLASSQQLGTLLAESDEPPLWRIAELHQVGDNTTITAAYKTGKSTLMLNLIRSLADGVPFLNRGVTPADRRIAYWNMELSKDRCRQWLRDVSVQNVDKVEVLNLRGRTLPLYDAEVRRDIIEWLKSHEVEVWVIDPAARILNAWPSSGNPENDSNAVGELTQILDDVQDQAGVVDLFLPIHAGRKEQDRARGATKWDDWTDVRWVIEKQQLAGEKARLFSAEGRDVDEEQQVLVMDEHTRRLTAVAADGIIERSNAIAVARALRKGDDVTNAELRKLIKGVGNDGKTDAIATAVEWGWVREVMDGRKKTYRLNRAHPDVKEMALDLMDEVE